MNCYLWFASILICGLFLPACSAVDPAAETRELQTGETAVATPSPPAEMLTSLPLTSTATRLATETATVLPLPTNLPTPGYTATPTATSTQIPSPTPTTAAPEHLQLLTAGQSLPINYDLLFLSDGELKLWQPQIGQVHSLLTNPVSNQAIEGWRITPDRQTILIAQIHTDDTPGFTLFLFDTNTRQLRELWSEADTYLFAYALADNGRSAAIITSTTSLSEDTGQDVIKVIDGEQGRATMLIDCPNRRQRSYENREIDHTIRCQHVVAVPNSDTWLWRDIEGVWQGGLNGAPRLLVMHDFFDDNNPPLIYYPTFDWSSDGRYQLLVARVYKGGTRWLLDMQTGQVVIVENSNFSTLDPGAIWEWTRDSRLLTVLPPNEDADVVMEWWHIEGVQMVQDTVLTLPNPNAVNIAVPSQLPDGRFALILNGSGPELGTITLIPGFDEPPRQLTTLPPLAFWQFAVGQSLTWTPDTAGAIYLLPGNERQRPFYLPADGATLYDLTDLLGSHITHLVWLP